MWIEGLGIRADIPRGWNGRITNQMGDSKETTANTLHAANFPLPTEVASFGGSLMGQMRIGDSFLALVECAGSELAHVGLYSAPDLVSVQAKDLVAGAMPEAYPGLYGFQHFCSLADRPFCLFVVASCSEASGALNLGPVNDLIASIEVSPIEAVNEAR
jgi:hypothetical protein